MNYNPTHSVVPSGECWRFQIGTSALMASIRAAQAAKAGNGAQQDGPRLRLRCGHGSSCGHGGRLRGRGLR